jgi:uncharacterized membrane protein
MQLVFWTLARVGLVGLLAWTLYRALRVGPKAGLSPAVRGWLVVAVLTLVWVYPGLLAAVVLVTASSSRSVAHRLR